MHKREWTLEELDNNVRGYKPWSFKEVEDEIRKSDVRYECVETIYRYHIYCRFYSMITTFLTIKITNSNLNGNGTFCSTNRLTFHPKTVIVFL